MKMNKSVITLLIVMCLMLAGCSSAKLTSSKSYTFNVETGDSVKVTLDTSDKYNLSSDLPFIISKDGQTLSQGIFITSETYAEYMDLISNDEQATVIDSGSNSVFEYVMWNYNNAEFNYAILLKNSKTGLLLANDVSDETAKECFKRLSLSLE